MLRNPPTLVESDSRGLLARIYLSHMRPVRVMSLLLHRRSKLEELLRHFLLGCLEHVDQTVTSSVSSADYSFDGKLTRRTNPYHAR
jgi:hypothetical protein